MSLKICSALHFNVQYIKFPLYPQPFFFFFLAIIDNYSGNFKISMLSTHPSVATYHGRRSFAKQLKKWSQQKKFSEQEFAALGLRGLQRLQRREIRFCRKPVTACMVRAHTRACTQTHTHSTCYTLKEILFRVQVKGKSKAKWSWCKTIKLNKEEKNSSNGSAVICGRARRFWTWNISKTKQTFKERSSK